MLKLLPSSDTGGAGMGNVFSIANTSEAFNDEGGMSTALAGRARIDRAEPAEGCLRKRCSSTH